MTKQEFLEQFEDALIGELSNAAIYDHKQYYERYINSEVRKGKTEAAIMEELGNPRLIAKTLIEMQSSENKEFYEDYKDSPMDKVKNGTFAIVLKKILLGVVGILCLVLLISFLTGIVSVVFRFAGPLLLIFLVIYVFRKLFEK